MGYVNVNVKAITHGKICELALKTGMPKYKVIMAAIDLLQRTLDNQSQPVHKPKETINGDV